MQLQGPECTGLNMYVLPACLDDKIVLKDEDKGGWGDVIFTWKDSFTGLSTAPVSLSPPILKCKKLFFTFFLFFSSTSRNFTEETRTKIFFKGNFKGKNKCKKVRHHFSVAVFLAATNFPRFKNLKLYFKRPIRTKTHCEKPARVLRKYFWDIQPEMRKIQFSPKSLYGKYKQ